MGFTKDIEEKGTCFNCGSQSDSFWHGKKGFVYVCERCAIDVLPKMISDAIMSKYTIDDISDQHVLRDFKKEKDIQISFYAGFECAILRIINKHLGKLKKTNDFFGNLKC